MAESGGRPRPRVLVLDDEEPIVRLAVTLLDGAGFEVKGTSSPREALRLAHEFRPNLIISDVMMPEMDGFDLCAQLRSAADTARIPVMFLSTRNTLADHSLGRDVGAQAYLDKPFTRDELVDAVHNVLDQMGLANPE